MSRRLPATPYRDGGSRTYKVDSDLEKSSSYTYPSREASFDDQSHFSADSILESPPPSQPILGRPMPKKKRRFQFYRVPNRIMRVVCMTTFFALLLFVFTLFRFSLTPAALKSVEANLPSAHKPKPPKWEEFPFLKRYYGGIRTLTSRNSNTTEYPNDQYKEPFEDDVMSDDKKNATVPSYVYNPYPNYASKEYVAKYGTKRDCFLDAKKTVQIPRVRYHEGVPEGFPEAVMGSNELLGINDNICFERFGRLGPYGFGYGVKGGGTGAGLEGERSGADEVWKDVPPVDYRSINWAEVQERCVAANNHRFPNLKTPRSERFRAFQIGNPDKKEEAKEDGKEEKRGGKNEPRKEAQKEEKAPEGATLGSERLPRTAVLIRTWHDYHYNEESIMYLRSLINELSLLSGGEYQVHFLIHVKDVNLPIWADDEAYDRILRDALPEEFYGMGVLWSERQMGLVYGGLEDSMYRNLPVHGVYRSTYMPLQYFAHQHPEYDYFWNWEMDARYSGHFYELFTKIGNWAKEQPRKGLWERNSRFYVPSVHGSWEDFRHTVRVQTEMGTDSPNNLWSAMNKENPKEGPKAIERQGDKPIWGPERPPSEQDVFQVEGEGEPPVSYEKDKYEWGVGEEADLIVFNPLYDPEGTTWLLSEDITGYDKEKGRPPRRAAIITASRLSRKLLDTMHRENSLKRHSMFSEMWPATTALHHGFKAVSAPHPIYVDRRWPTRYLENTFNGGRNGATGGARTSVFGDREHNFRGTTWFYSAGHPINVWRRWFGYRVDNGGGEEEEMAGEGRMCLPPMLLHPIKEVDLILESPER